jgi:hypothetical protein
MKARVQTCGPLILFASLLVTLAGPAISTAAANPCDVPSGARRLHVRDFNAVGDGKTDDGAAIREAIKSALSGPQPVSIEFDAGKVYRITSFEDRYGFQILNGQKITLLGNGAELSLLPPNKVLQIVNSSDINICGLTVDYSPLPFTQGMVVSTDAAAGTFDLQIESGFDIPPVDDNSTTDNSRVWKFAKPYRSKGQLEKRIQITAIHGVPGTERIRVKPENRADVLRLVPNQHHLVMAMPRMGQVGTFAIRILNSARVLFQDIRVYSVPQQAFYIGDNDGPVTFSKVEQRIRPGTSRVMTGWRGVFMAKDNRAPVHWDGCYVEGASDDAFNLSATYQLVVEKLDERRWRLRDLSARRESPVYKAGDRLQVIQVGAERKRLPDTKVVSVAQDKNDLLVTLSSAIALKPEADSCSTLGDTQQSCGSRVVNLDAANEGSTIRNSTIHGNMRIRSKAVVEKVHLDGFIRITSDPTRVGPLPDGIVFRDSTLTGGVIRLGTDGNRKRKAKRNQSWTAGDRWIQNITFQNTRIGSKFRARGASFALIDTDVTWRGGKKFQLENSGPVLIRNLSANGQKVPDPMKLLRLGGNMTEKDVVIEAR